MAVLPRCRSQCKLCSPCSNDYLTNISASRWLGQNSKQNKLNRQLMDIQARMRLKVSSDKLELRQSYIPALFPYVVKPLMDEGVVRICLLWCDTMRF
jgi:hypothetical protein